jgi:hypothetical protein
MGDHTLNTNLHFYSHVAEWINANDEVVNTREVAPAQSECHLAGSIPALTTIN